MKCSFCGKELTKVYFDTLHPEISPVCSPECLLFRLDDYGIVDARTMDINDYKKSFGE